MGVSSPGQEPMGLNEDEPQLMSLVKKYNRRRRVAGVMRKADAGSAGNRGGAVNSGGVGVAGTSGRPVTDKAGRSGPMMKEQGHQPVEQAGVPGKEAGVGAEVGGVRSSEAEGEVHLGELSAEVLAMLKALSRDSACSHASRRSEGQGDGPGQKGIITPEKIRKLQRTLYRKAKAEPKYRFWSLYGSTAGGLTD